MSNLVPDIIIMLLNQVDKIVGFEQCSTLLICDTETISCLSNKGELKKSSVWISLFSHVK